MQFECCLFYSPLRSSSVSVVFDFSASPNAVAPVFPMLFTVDLVRMEKSGLLMDAICVLFLLCLQLILSFASVVFDFNASLNDAAPLSPILFPVDLMRMEKEWIVDGCHLCVVSFVFTPQIEFNECCV